MPHARRLFPLLAAVAGISAMPFGAPIAAHVIGFNGPAQSLTAQRIAALPAGERAAWADYLARSIQLGKADHASLAAERKPGQMWVLPPDHYGPGIKSMPLDKDAAWYAGAEARKIAENVLSFQTPAGGWGKNQDRAAPPRQPGQDYANKAEQTNPDRTNLDAPHDIYWTFVGTLDNGATVGELRFLAKVIAAAPAGAAGRTRYEASFVKGVRYLLDAQYPNGGWPQIYPLEGDFHDSVTFNDNAVARVAELLREVGGEPGYEYVPAELRTRSRAAQAKAVDVILAAQYRLKGRPVGWPQQVDPLTLAPASARNYEPPAICSDETTDVLLFLMEQKDPSPAVRRAVVDGVAWLKASAVYGKAWVSTPDGRKLIDRDYGGPLWSRLYDPATNKPIFGDWDKYIRDDVNEISIGRRNGYGWYVTTPEKAIDTYHIWRETWRMKDAEPS
jgi:PelA/Pel-15E family pectate lyase